MDDTGISSVESKMDDAAVSSVEFADCVAWLSSEMKKRCHLEECLRPMAGPEDEESFYIELKSFLRELKCPLVTECSAKNQWFRDAFHQREVLEFLMTELLVLEAAVDEPESNEEQSILSHLQSASSALDIEDYDGAPVDTLKMILEKVKERIDHSPENILGDPLLTDTLTEDQWDSVDKLNKQMTLDYNNRAEMMLKRLGVTIQSFSWSDRLKERKKEITGIYDSLRQQLSSDVEVNLADILAARKDLTHVEKASNSNLYLGNDSKLPKLTLQGVGPPDRGGRPKDVLRMPQWKQRLVEGGGGPQRERQRHKRHKKSKDDDGSNKSGYASMKKRSQRSNRKKSGSGSEISDTSQI